MPRYVILLHEMPEAAERATHWDLMLEAGEGLRTWALAGEPLPGSSISAEQLADHRPAYLDYEGPVSGNRGHVSQWDAGEYETKEERDGMLVVALAGRRLRGTLSLIRSESQPHFWSVSVSAAPMRS